MKTRRSSVLVAVWLLVLVACGTGQDETQVEPTDADGGQITATETVTDQATAGPQQAETVRMSIGADEATLTPYTYVTGSPGWNMLNLVYDTLLVLDEDNVPQPLLASDVQASDDLTTWTLTLRDDVTWHDGEPFTAQDVVFTFNYVTEHEHSRWTSEAAGVESIEADGNEVVITLAEPDPVFRNRPLADMPMLPQHIWEDVDDPEAATVEQAVGTGPFRLVDHQPDQRYRLEANEDYFAGPVTVGELVVPVIPEPATAFSAVRSGEIDAAFQDLEPRLIEQFEQADNLGVISGPGFRSELLQFNNEHPILQTVEVRKAIGHAIDVEELVDTVLLGFGIAGSPGFAHPESPLAVEPIEHEFDPDLARELLEEAGFTEGPDGTRARDGQTLAFTLIADAADPFRVRSGELIREMLAEVGIDVTLETMERSTVVDRVWPDFDVSQGRNFDLAMFGWSPPVMLDSSRLGDLVHSDPERGSINIGGFQDEAVDALVEELDATVDEQERQDLILEIEQAIAEKRPFVTLAYPDLVYAYRPSVYDGWVFQNGQGIFQKLSFTALP